MPRIGELFGIFFYLYFREHGLPHIHAFYGGKVAVIGLDGTLLEGKLPKKQLKIARKFVIEYAEDIQEKIIDIEASKKGEKPGPIIKSLTKKSSDIDKTKPEEKP
jgi:Domain of unknown function (DUF4160)